MDAARLIELLTPFPNAREVIVKGRRADEVSCSIPMKTAAQGLPLGWEVTIEPKTQAIEGWVRIIHREADPMKRPVACTEQLNANRK